MNINISYDPYQHNWYVGELYKTFHQYLVDQKYNVNYIHIKDLAKKYDEWYHLKYKKWFLWHDVTERSGRFMKKFNTIEEVNKYIGLMTIKKVECWEENRD